LATGGNGWQLRTLAGGGG